MNIYTENQNDIIHETSVDFVLRPCTKEIHIVQYDKSLPVIKVELFRNGERYALPENAAVNIRVGKLDHTFVYESVLGTNEERNVVYFEISEQMALIAGKIWPVLEVIETNKVACSSPLCFIIERNPIQEGQIESHDDFPIIYELQGSVADHEVRISNLESQVGGEVVTLHTDQDNIDGRKTFKNSVTIENNLSSTDKYLGSLRFTGDTLQEENAPIITVRGSDGLMTFLKISDDGDVQGDGLDLHNVTHIYGLHLPERNNEAVNKEYADRKLELHPFDGFVGGSQVHEQIQNGQIKYCQSGTQTDIDPSQAPIINIELTQEHISSVSNKKAVYIKKIHIEYELDSEIGVNKTWEYEFTSRIFGSGSASDDINPKVASLSDITTGLALEWTLIYRPATGKQYYGSYNPTKGQQFGSNTHPSDYISLYTTSIQNATIKNVWIEVSGNSGTTAKIKLTLVQDQWTVNDIVDPNITASNEQYVFYHEGGTHLGSGSGEIIEYNHVFLKKENDVVISISAKSEYLYIEEDPSKESDTYRLYKYVDDQMQEVSKTRLGTTSDTAYRGDYGQDNYNKLKQVREQEFTFYGEKTFGDGLNIQNSVDHDSYNISTYKIDQEYNVDELQIQKKGNTYSILSVIAPIQDPKESTLALKVENSGNNSNETYLMDISVMNYMNPDEDPEESIYIQSRNASVKPNFNIGYTDETQTRHKKFIVTHDALPIMLKNTGIWIKNTNDKSIHSWANRTELSLAELQSIKTIGSITTRVTNLENNVVYKGDATQSLRLYTFGKFEGATYNSLQVAIAYTDWHNYALIPNIKCLNESVVRLEPTGANQNYDSGVYQIYGHMPLSAAEDHRYSLEYCFNISNTPNATYIPQYNEAGRLKSNDPYFDDDVATKQYADTKVTANAAITGATKCKITYDSKGLVTAGADLAASDIPSLDASKITSGTFADARIASASIWNAKYSKPSGGIPASDLAETYVKANNAITGATKCKITYDSKGLVTAGADLAASDIPSLDASKITSGTFADARIASASTWNAKYSKPSGGIPASDLAETYVKANNAITGATKCKITYDSKGLVTAGADLAASDIPSLDASKITSGTFADARIASASTWNAKYSKPSGGIPASDLAQTYVVANAAITGATKCKITYDAKGLVTAGADLAASDIPSLDASKITSGTIDAARLPAARGHHVYIELVASSTDRSNQHIDFEWITSDGEYHHYTWYQKVGSYFEAEDVILLKATTDASSVSSGQGTNMTSGSGSKSALVIGYRYSSSAGKYTSIFNYVTSPAYLAIDSMISAIATAKAQSFEANMMVQLYSDVELMFEWED